QHRFSFCQTPDFREEPKNSPCLCRGHRPTKAVCHAMPRKFKAEAGTRTGTLKKASQKGRLRAPRARQKLFN
ncbi:MAG: hypothetical protein Q4F13_04730, partial [Pseudomonadota bacterium]|nr:hypothetical protein [Pseudomonadota bacterium]